MQASFLHFVLKKNYEKYQRWFAGANTRTEEKKLACGWRFSRALVYLVVWGQVHDHHWHVETEAFFSQHSGGTTTSHNFFSVSRSDGFLADRDLWKVLCQFICMENSTIYYTVTSLGQSFGGLFSLVEPGCLQYVLLWILSQLNYGHSAP